MTQMTGRTGALAAFIESLEFRRLLTVSFPVSFNDPGGSHAAYYDRIRTSIQAAGKDWSASIAGNGSLEVSVQFSGSIPTANGRSVTNHYLRNNGSYNVYQEATIYEVVTGTDVNGSAPDVEFTIGNAYLQNELWFDPTPADSVETVPGDRTDALTVFRHELGHAFGFNGWRSSYDGTLPGDYESTFDEKVVYDGSNLYFTGPKAKAAHGGQNVPLTYGNSTHVGNDSPRPGSDLVPDLMNGVVFYRGVRYPISKLDLGVVADAGLPITTTTTPPSASGSITGKVFADADLDGALDAGEAGKSAWRVYLDADRDGVFDSTEKCVFTSGTGDFSFAGLAAGNYRVRVVPAGGWRVTGPAVGYFDLNLATNASAVAGKNFGATNTVQIAGSVFKDVNGDGVRAAGTDTALAGRTVFVDANKNGILDASERRTTTDAAGNYVFKGLAAGTYRVADVRPSGWRRSLPSAGYYDVALASGQAASGKSFGSTQRVLISGTVFNDANGDRARQGAEAGRAGWRVYVDANRDGVYQSSERSLLSDAVGYWVFKDLAAGSYLIRVVQQAGYTRTTPTAAAGGAYSLSLGVGATATAKLFGERKL